MNGAIAKKCLHLDYTVFICGCCAPQLSLPSASEVIFDSEVYFVSEVLPYGRVANLTSLLH